MTVIDRGLEFKLDPTKTEEQKLWQFAGAARWVWNYVLDNVESYYKDNKTFLPPKLFDTVITYVKSEPETAWLATIHSQVLQQPTADLRDAYDRYFKKQNKKPKFKKRGKNDHFRYPHQGSRKSCISTLCWLG